ncbi:hypothetical protein, partial [Klebsiella pneumoniae]|uniref:hypothetical protein n=1 Tax=Klebsiella pneumoniae TaxID=573 RepID=UPI001954015C
HKNKSNFIYPSLASFSNLPPSQAKFWSDFMHVRLVAALSGALILAGAVPGSADDYYYEGQQNQTAAAPRQHWWSGDWY